MAKVNGQPGFTQLDRLNVTESLLLQGVPVASAASLSIERLYDGQSALIEQQPLALATPLEIQFGPVQGTSSDPVQTLARGGNTEASIVQFNQAGTYLLKSFAKFGRSGAAGTSFLNFRALFNGVQAGRTITATLQNANESDKYQDESWLTIPAGVQLTFEVIRDSNGNNSGGLLQGETSGSPGWNMSPCAAVRVERWAQ